MPIPRTRAELIELVRTSYERLDRELSRAGPGVESRICVDQWSVRELLAIRAGWTASVLEWIEAGRRGEVPVLPAPGYKWSETPRLNLDLARQSRSEPYEEIRKRLQRGFQRVMSTIEDLDDRELLEVGVFKWAGKWPISRWISINTARQYTTAYAFIRRTVRSRDRRQERRQGAG